MTPIECVILDSFHTAINLKYIYDNVFHILKVYNMIQQELLIQQQLLVLRQLLLVTVCIGIGHHQHYHLPNSI